jgi:cardiolipin synthase (CMP-forming)
MSFTIPNLLSLLRMGLVPPFIIALLNGQAKRALLIMLLAGISDALDGFIARFFHQQSLLGTYLDPLADKLLVTAAYITLALPGLRPGAFQIPAWVTVVVIARDVLLVVVALVLYLAAGVRRFPASLLSKITTVFQFGAVVVALATAMWPELDATAVVLVHTVAILTLASGLDYVWRANRLFDRHPPSASPPAAA